MTRDQLIDKKHITAITYFVQIDSTDIDEVTKCVKSYKPFVDRFVVIQNNDGKVYESIRQLADIYIVNKVNKLMAGGVNEGYKIASAFKDSEYLLFIDSGTTAKGLDTYALCTDGVASPHIGSQEAGYLAHASCFCVHKDTFERIGLWDSSFGNTADDDWFKRAKALGIPMYQTKDYVSHDSVRRDTGRVDEFNLLTEQL